jgi:hypothetical protein
MANDGTRVLKEVVQLTGLPEEYLNDEISQFLGTTNTTVNELSLEQLRAALLNYLESVNEQITQEIGQEESSVPLDRPTAN